MSIKYEKNLGFVDIDPSRRPIHYDLIVAVFKVYHPDKDSESQAVQLIRERAQDICNGITERIGEDGLPLDRRDLLALEEDLHRFGKVLPFHLYRKANIRKEQLVVNTQGQVDPSKVQQNSNRGKIEEFLDEDHPVVGPYIHHLKGVSELIGVPTDELVHRKNKVDTQEQKETVMIECARVAKDMIMLIGKEKYDQVRKKITLVFCREYDSEFFLKQSPYEAAHKMMDRHSYWNALPRAWVEELLILGANPDLVDKIIASPRSPGTCHVTTSTWIKWLSVKTTDYYAEKQTHQEYMQTHLAPEIRDKDQFEEVISGIQKLINTFAERGTQFPIINEKEFGKNENRKKMEEIIRTFVSVRQNKAENWLHGKLLELTSKIQKLDKIYRKANRKVTHKERAWSQFHYKDAARALSDSVAIYDTPLIDERSTFVDEETSTTFKIHLNLTREGERSIKVTAFDNRATNGTIYFNETDLKDLRNEFNKNSKFLSFQLLRGLLFVIDDIIEESDETFKNYRTKRLTSIEDPKELFTIYRLIKYLMVTLQVLMKENEEDVNEELNPNHILKDTSQKISDIKTA